MELLLVNPRRRKRRKASSRRRRRRAVRRVARRRRRAIAIAPRRRRRRSARRAIRIGRRRRNPSVRGFINQLQPTVKAGIVGAVGALGLDVLLGFLLPKLPAGLQAGYGKTAAKVLGAIGVGMVGNALMRGRGRDLATGAMTVVLHDELKTLISANFPALALGEYYPSYAPAVGTSSGIPGLLSTGYEGMGGETYGQDDALAAGGAYGEYVG